MKIKLEDYIPSEIIPKRGKNKSLLLRRWNNKLILSAKRCRKIITLPINLNLKKDDFLFVGAYLAEGNKKINVNGQHHTGQVAFSNSNVVLLDLFCKFMNRLGISKSKLKWTVDLNINFKKQVSKQEIIGYWVKFGLDSKSLRPKWFRYRGTYGSKIPIKGAKYGCLTLAYDSVILRNVILNLIYKLFDEALKRNEKQILAYILSGYFGGDGHVNYDKKGGSRKQVEFLCNNTLLRNKLKSALKIVGLKNIRITHPESTKTHSYSLRIYNKQDFLTLHKYDILSLVSYKRETFCNLLENYKSLTL